MIPMKWFDVNEDDSYEMVWWQMKMTPIKWFDVNKDDPYEMVWCKWRWSLWNGLM